MEELICVVLICSAFGALGALAEWQESRAARPPQAAERRDWYCPDCIRPVALNRHARCERCDSDKVTQSLWEQRSRA